MIRTFATTATALCLAAPFVLAGPQDDAQARNYLLSGEMIVFSAAEQRLPAGWSLAVDGVPAEHSIVAPLSGQSELIETRDTVASFFSTPMATGAGQFTLRNDDGRNFGLGELSVALYDGAWSVLSHASEFSGRPVFVLTNTESAFIQRGEGFTLTGELALAPQIARELGITLGAPAPVGALTVMGSAFFDPARPVSLSAPASGTLIGPDVIVSTIGSTYNEYGAASSIGAYAVTTVSCNVGDQDAIWIDAGAQPNRHPVIGTQLYRHKTVAGATRFEQVGMSWLKHGFCAAGPCGIDRMKDAGQVG